MYGIRRYWPQWRLFTANCSSTIPYSRSTSDRSAPSTSPWCLYASAGASSRGESPVDIPSVLLDRLLAELASIDGRLFTVACTKSQKIFASYGAVSAEPVVCSAQELMQIAGVSHPMKIDRTILQLANLGLLEPRVKSKYFNSEQEAILRRQPWASNCLPVVRGTAALRMNTTQPFQETANPPRKAAQSTDLSSALKPRSLYAMSL